VSLAELSDRIAGEVREDRATRLAYATDASVYRVEPRAVLVAREVDDLRAALAYAREHGLPLTLRGAGTSLAGQTVGAGLVVDAARCDRILEIDAAQRLARVEPGVVQAHLDGAAGAHGLCLGPDTSTATRATLGGMIGNDSAGMRSVVYGRTSHRIRRLRVALADGSEAWVGPTPAAELGGPWRAARELFERMAPTLDARWPRLLRCVDGYNLAALAGDEPNLARLVCGSEGTLAVVLEAEVELDPRPESRVWTIVRLPGVDAVSDATLAALTTSPSAVELVDARALVGSQAAREIADGAEAVLLVEHGGDAADATARRAGLAAAGVPGRLVHVDGPDATARLVAFRRDLQGTSVRSVRGGRLPTTVVEDAAVPVERLSAFLRELRGLFRDEGTASPLYGHASVGLVHARPLLDLSDPEDRRRFRRVAEAGADLVAAHGGALSGEHGDGILRGELLARVYGDELVAAFGELKRIFDPAGILNPGRIVDAPPLDASLRAAPGHVRAPLETAAARCIGVGACVELRAGTICPPYRISRDELHGTRGRADLLREVLAGNLAADDPGFAESLDTCISCKACISECPAGVDVAWLKAQHLAARPGRRSRRERALADLPTTLARLGRVPHIANGVARTPLAVPLRRMLGLHPRRPLPRVARRPLRALAAGRYGARSVGAVLFVDTFTEWLEPEIGLAALDYLDAAGAAPALAPNVCCGRTYISAGMLDEATRLAEENVRRLLPLAQAGVPILGLEPSCILTLRDELPKLVPGEEARTIARSALLLEEALERFDAPRLRRATTPMVVHPHCHARALSQAGAIAAALARIPGAEIETLDAGCCGMAGGFGYRRERFALSRAMAERALLPALRERPGAVVVAHGTSCRSQLADLAGIRALHPAQVLAGQLAR
jgi:FAD/FMN-containing dehydrogenase/Fe-S oxidoreductase